MKISIFGLGYVGAVSLACLARDGHDVIGVDIDSVKLELIAAGLSPVIEQGMPELMAEVVASGRVKVTDDAQAAVAATDLSFICVGTPSQPNGSQDQGAVIRLTEQLGAALAYKSSEHVFVFRSTLVPGTVETILKPALETRSGKRAQQDFHICFQPEFLREGSSVKDYDHPPFTVVGAGSAQGADRLRSLFGHLPGEFLVTSIRSAEMMKYACNAFHALKITFANEMGRICQALGVDSHEVMDLLCRDRQLNISAAYLKPGFAFGGSCLPKDLRALLHIAKIRDIDMPMLAGVLPSNTLPVQHALTRVLASGKRRIGMIGLSFKSGTDDLRESPLVELAEALIGKGLQLSIFDPEVNVARLIGANKRFIDNSIPHIGALMTDDCERLIADNDIIIVGLNDAKALDVLRQKLRSEHIILDLVAMPQRQDLPGQYYGICW